MATSQTDEATQPTSTEPHVAKSDEPPVMTGDSELADNSSGNSSGSGSDGEGPSRSSMKQRPKLHTRKSSGTIIIPRDDPNVEIQSEDYDEGDARAMSPRRSSEELDRMEDSARQALVEQAQQLQATLLDIVERVESVRAEHEKLEGGNRFLQSYIGELMQTSKITSTSVVKGRGKGRTSK